MTSRKGLIAISVTVAIAAAAFASAQPLLAESPAQATAPTATPVPSAASPVTSPITATSAISDAVPRLLVERLIGAYSFGPTGKPVEPQLFVGQLPPDLAQLPIPGNTVVLGGVARGTTGAEALLDSTQPPKAVTDFYTAQLKAGGWTTPTFDVRGPGGFTPTDMGMGTMFCKGNDGQSLSVSARASKKTGTTDVRLTLMKLPKQANYYGPCNQPPSPMGPHMQLPQLIAPEGARQQGGGMSGMGPNSFSSYASVATTMTLAALHDAYAAQLTDAGWTRGESSDSGLVVWSRWTGKDDKGNPRNGLFFVLDEGKDEEESLRFVYFKSSTPGAAGSSSIVQSVVQLARPAP